MTDDLDWDDNSDAQYRVNCERLLTLWQTELEPIEQTVLKELQQRQFFTDLETQIVTLMEAKRLSTNKNSIILDFSRTSEKSSKLSEESIFLNKTRTGVESGSETKW